MLWGLCALVLTDTVREHAFASQPPWRQSVTALHKVLDSVKIDLQTQQKFQSDKNAYCDSLIASTRERIDESRRTVTSLEDDKVELQATIDGLDGEVASLEEKLRAVRTEIESTQKEQQAAHETEEKDVVLLKQALVSTDFGESSADLAKPRKVLTAELLTLEAKHAKKAAILAQFSNDKRKEALELENNLQTKRNEVLEKRAALAEVVRTTNDSTRMADRDAAYLNAVQHECDVFNGHEKLLKRSRTRLRDLLKGGVEVMEKKAQALLAVQSDLVGVVRSLATTPSSFLQLATTTQQRTQGPFESVIATIRDMIQRMESEMNKDKGKQAWCQEETSKNDAARIKYRDEINQHQGEIRRFEDQLDATKGARSFASKMIANNQKLVSRAHNEIAALDDRFQTALRNAKTAGDVIAEAEETLQNDSGLTKALSYLEQAKDEAANLKGLITAAESETIVTLKEVEKDAKDALEARKRDLSDDGAKFAELKDQLALAKADLKAAKGRLANVQEYEGELQSQCGPASADDAAQRRKEEIEALQDALKVLNGEEIPV